MVAIAIVIISLLFIAICAGSTIFAYVFSEQGAYMSKGARSFEFNLTNNSLRRVNRIYLRRAFFEVASDRNWRGFNEMLQTFNDVKTTNILAKALGQVKQNGIAQAKAEIALPRSGTVFKLTFAWTKTASSRCFLTVTWMPVAGELASNGRLKKQNRCQEVAKLSELNAKVYAVFGLQPFSKKHLLLANLNKVVPSNTKVYLDDGLMVVGFSAERLATALCQARRMERRLNRLPNPSQFQSQVKTGIIYTPEKANYENAAKFDAYLHYLCSVTKPNELALVRQNDALLPSASFEQFATNLMALKSAIKTGNVATKLVPVISNAAAPQKEFGTMMEVVLPNLNYLTKQTLSRELWSKLIDANATALINNPPALQAPVFVDVTLDWLARQSKTKALPKNIIWVVNLTPGITLNEISAVLANAKRAGGRTAVRVQIAAYLGRPHEQMQILALLTSSAAHYFVIDADFFTGTASWTSGKIYQLLLAINNVARANNATVFYETLVAATGVPTFMKNGLFLQNQRAART